MARRSVSVFGLCMVLCMSATGLFAQDSARMEHRFAPGQNLRYKVSALMTVGVIKSDSKQDREPAMSIRISGEFLRRVKQVSPNGDAEILYTFSPFEADFGHGNTALPPMSPVSAIVGKDGVIKSLMGVSDNPIDRLTFMNPTNFGQLSVAFGEKDLKPGESWEKESAFGLGDKNKGVMKAGYVLGIPSANTGSRSPAVFDEKETGKAEYAVSDSHVTDMRVVNRWQATNRFTFDLDQGCITATDGASTSRLTMTLPASADKQEQVAILDIDMKYQVALVKDKAKQTP